MRFREFKTIITEATKGKHADVAKFDEPGYFSVGDSHSNGVGNYGRGKTWKAMGMDGASAFDPMHMNAISRIPSGSVVAISAGANDIGKPTNQIMGQVNKLIAAAAQKGLTPVYLLPTSSAQPSKKEKRDELRNVLSAGVTGAPIIDLGMAGADGLHLSMGAYGGIASKIVSQYKLSAPSGQAAQATAAAPADQDKKPSDSTTGFNVTVPSNYKGIEVADIQKLLQAMGYELAKYGVDGIKGPETTEAIRQFQKAEGLPNNGAADEATIAKMNAKIAADPKLAKLSKSTTADVKGRSDTSSGDGKTLQGTRESGAAFKEPYFMDKLKEVSSRLGVSESDLIGIMKHESNLNPRAVNPMSRATGLIQFMPKTARGLGTTIDEIYKMSATEQLDLVEKYYKRNGIKAGDDIADLYMLTFMPAAKDKPDNFVLGNANGGQVFGLSMAAIYRQNQPFDSNGDGIFTVGDIKDRIRRFA